MKCKKEATLSQRRVFEIEKKKKKKSGVWGIEQKGQEKLVEGGREYRKREGKVME